MTPPPVPSVRCARFGPLPQPVRFVGCDDLLDATRSILRGWRVTRVARGRAVAPAIRVRRTADGYRRVSKWQDRPSRVREKFRRTLVEALCGLHSELLDWYVEEHPDTLFVHGAAARFGRRLVVFPALAYAGKSTLTVHLAQRGRQVWCDDVLPIDPRTRRGLALGIVPRLRPPLPPSASAAFLRFVEARRGHERRDRLYVNLRRGEIAPWGATAPVGGIVLLERQPSGPAVLEPVEPADALEKVILQNFAREVPALRILDTLERVVRTARCYRLRYAKTEDAGDLLDGAFLPPRARGRRRPRRVRR